jgi:hypothetical protein
MLALSYYSIDNFTAPYFTSFATNITCFSLLQYSPGLTAKYF